MLSEGVGWHAVSVEIWALAVCCGFIVFLVVELVRHRRKTRRLLAVRRTETDQVVIDLREEAVDAFFDAPRRPADRRPTASPARSSARSAR